MRLHHDNQLLGSPCHAGFLAWLVSACSSGNRDRPVVDSNPYTNSVDEIRAAVEEAHGAGLEVAAHCVRNEGCRRAAEAGVDSSEHGYQLRADVIRLLAAKKIYLVATDSTADMYEQMGLPP